MRIADDAAILRDGLAQLLTLRGHEVRTNGDAEALITAVAEDVPDAAVVDVRMPPTHTDEGLRAALRLRREHPGLGVLLFSRHIETRYVADLLAEGSAGVGYRNAGRCPGLQAGGEGPRWEGRQGPSSVLSRGVLLLDVLLHEVQRCPADRAREV